MLANRNSPALWIVKRNYNRSFFELKSPPGLEDYPRSVCIITDLKFK